jgi:hypothetical protein
VGLLFRFGFRPQQQKGVSVVVVQLALQRGDRSPSRRTTKCACFEESWCGLYRGAPSVQCFPRHFVQGGDLRNFMARPRLAPHQGISSFFISKQSSSMVSNIIWPARSAPHIPPNSQDRPRWHLFSRSLPLTFDKHYPDQTRERIE